jgi:hypothetical protein
MYMKESDTALWLCGDGDKSIGYINGDPVYWYGAADIMPQMEYSEAREGETFECLNGDEYINRGGWQEMGTYVDSVMQSESERMVAIWA